MRTVLRDLETLSGSGITVYATRGPNGGFQLLDTHRPTEIDIPPGFTAERGKLRRVRVRIAPATLQLALVSGRPEGWRRRPTAPAAPGRPDWIEGSLLFDSYDTALRELLAIGPGVEILLPIELRCAMADVARRLARLHRPAS